MLGWPSLLLIIWPDFCLFPSSRFLKMKLLSARMKSEKRKFSLRASLMAQTVKNPPAMWETWIQSLGWKDALEEGMATHSRILAWRTPMDKSLAGYSPWDCKRLDTTEQLSTAQVQENEPCWSSWYMVPVYFTETYISTHDVYNRPISLYTHIFNFSLIWQMF